MAKGHISYPTPEEFRIILKTRDLAEIVQEYLFQGPTYLTELYPGSLEVLYRHLDRELGIPDNNISIIGSAKMGFSLAPVTFSRRFTAYSDVDVFIVGQDLFDSVWETMLKWNYPRRFKLAGMDWEWMKDRRDELYWGWFMPDKIRFEGLSFPRVLKPLRDVSTAWFSAFRGLSQYNEFSGRNVSGRLYRTWKHASLYLEAGLRRVRDMLYGGGTS